AETEGVIMPGYVSGELRHQLLSHAALFAMPSYHEGLPIALLEALSYGLDVAVSDIPANVIAPLDRKGDYFHTGDVESLAGLLTSKLQSAGVGHSMRRVYDLTPYDWDSIAAATVAVYESI
ncbi:MAG: glycosyltransferase, partial [Duncaniella sp.]|nr:glycosyltransferase [Duncaniella sp.]